MDKPEPKKFAIRNFTATLKISVEDTSRTPLAEEEAKQFGRITEHDEYGFVLQVRNTFDMDQVEAYLNEKFEEIL